MNSFVKNVLIVAGIGFALYSVMSMSIFKTWLKKVEGFSPTAYKDGSGWSIGYGHQILPGEPYAPIGTQQSITEAEASQLLEQDLTKARDAVLYYTKVPLTSNQLNALSSFVYNIGINAFADSTLLKKLNAGDFTGALNEMARWTKSGGETNAGLAYRRAQEQQMFAS